MDTYLAFAFLPFPFLLALLLLRLLLVVRVGFLEPGALALGKPAPGLLDCVCALEYFLRAFHFVELVRLALVVEDKLGAARAVFLDSSLRAGHLLLALRDKRVFLPVLFEVVVGAF